MQINAVSLPYKCLYVEGPPKRERGSQGKTAHDTEHFAWVNFLRISHFPGVSWDFYHVNWRCQLEFKPHQLAFKPHQSGFKPHQSFFYKCQFTVKTAN